MVLYFPVKYITCASPTVREDVKVVLDDISDPLAMCLQVQCCWGSIYFSDGVRIL